jgi:predicted acyl esterase
VPQATHGALIQSDVRITMSDSVVLVGDVSYPTDLGTRRRSTGRFPVILTQNPYGAVFGAASGEIFVTHGYIFASVDVRGTSRSSGVHDMFAPREAEDGAALVEWASKLEGSDGTVGLHGCSQLGINQLETVTQLKAASPVKAMIPACGSGDFYRDTAFDNGIPTAVGESLVLFSGSGAADMYLYRDYWRIRDRVARATAIAATGIPMLLWSGWHEPGALGSLELYTALQNLAAGRPASAKIEAGAAVSGKYQVILGDWAHAGGLDQGIQLQWFDTWIKGIDTGLPKETETPLHLELLGGAKRWINARTYPLVPRYTALYLASGNKLLREAEASAGMEQLRWVPPGSRGAEIEFASEPFAAGATLAGPIAARLEAGSSNSNLQLALQVFARAPNGALSPISRGSVLGSLRRTDPERSWTDEQGLPIRPHLTLDENQPVTPNTTTRLEFPLWPSVYSIEPGHSVVVRVSTQPRSEDCGALLGVPVGCNPTAEMRQSLTGGVYTLHRGAELRSLISLPLAEYGAFKTAASATSPTLDSSQTPLPIDW